MKGKRKKIWIGALSTLAMASVSVAALGLTGVQAGADTVDISKDASKWQTIDGMTADATYGLVPNVLASNKSEMRATSIEYTSDISGKITSDLSGGSYGVMAYYLKWNDGVDSVSWDWQPSSVTAGASNEFATHNNGSEKIVATGVKGDWIAVIISYAKAPMVLECKSGVITTVCDIWANGFGTADYQSYFNQETQISYSVSDTASGVSYQFGFYSPDNGLKTQVGMTATGGVQNSTNAKLQGDGAIRIEKIVAGAEFTTGNASYVAGTGAPASFFNVEVDGAEATEDTETTVKNVLKDGDFASGDWSKYWNAGWTSNGARTIENGALKMTNDTATSQYVAQLVTLTAGKTYKFSADLKIENIGEAGGAGGEGAWAAVLNPSKAAVKKAGYEGVTTEGAQSISGWKTFTFEVTPEQTGDFRVAFYLYGVTGSLWVDNVELLDLSAGEEESTVEEFGTDASKWQSLSKISVGDNGLVPSEPFFTATSVEVGGNSSFEIVTDFAEGGNLWGCTVYFFKWNEDFDSVNWVYATESSLPFDGNSGSGMTVASASGNWIALVVNTVTAPAVYECNNGTVSYKGNLWKSGFNGYDYWYIYNQKTSVKFACTDMESGASISIWYDAIDAGVTESSFSYSSTNTQLRGEGGVVINHLTGTAPFTNTANSISVKVDDIDSEYTSSVNEEIAKQWAENVSYPTDFSDGSFTLVGIGDPQMFTKNGGSLYTEMYQWIANNKNTLNIKYAVNVGDTVDYGLDEASWQLAKNAHQLLQNVNLPYVLTIGNHDYEGYWGLFDTPPVMDRTSTYFDSYFPYENYVQWLGEANFGTLDSTSSKMRNTWHKFENGNDKYLIIALEYGVQATTVAQAAAVIEANPDYKVIISTHSYLNGDTTYNNDGYINLQHDGAISSEQLWDTLISKHSNVFMVLCGHTVSYGVSTKVVYGDAGNPIIQMKVDAQGTFDDQETLIALYNIKGTSVQTYYYSVSSGRYYAGSNFSLKPVQGENGVVKVQKDASLTAKDLLGFAALDGVQHATYGTPTSSDTNVATIDENGNITIKNAGTTTITYVLSGRNSAYATSGVLTSYTVTIEVLGCQHEAGDNDKNHLCDDCGDKISSCTDGDNNHKCDTCGATLTTCNDGDDNHKCDLCGATLSDCDDSDTNHACDICGKEMGKHEAADGTHICGYCGDKVSDCDDSDTDHECDICGEAVGTHEAADGTHICGYCGEKASDCDDSDTNHACDICGEAMGKHEAADGTHVCEYCGEKASDCGDSDTDHVCDICGEAMGKHEAADGTHICEYCGEKASDCDDADTDHECDICGEAMGKHEAGEGTHTCEYCGEKASDCDDVDTDHACDICGEAMGKHEAAEGTHTCEYCGEKASDCDDTDTNHECDICGETMGKHEAADGTHTCDYCGDKVSDCEDENTNHACDICGEILSVCGDADDNHYCDVCGKQLSVCNDGDDNHKCDLCGATLTTCNDGDNNHKCDLCGATLSDCEDEDTNHVCDICSGNVGEHKGTAISHICEYCGEKASDCEDEDTNHACDICEAAMGKHEAAEGAHECAYCGEVASECVDENKNHACDICSATVGVHEPEEGSHSCGHCGKAMTECEDEDTDHECDICGGNVGVHVAATGTHECVYCGGEVSDCEDTDTNHVCDVCGEAVGTHEAGEGKHTCDYCGESVSTCADNDSDGKCDVCGETVASSTPNTNNQDQVSNDDEMKGCSGSISGLAVVGVALVACVAIKKRKED